MASAVVKRSLAWQRLAHALEVTNHVVKLHFQQRVLRAHEHGECGAQQKRYAVHEIKVPDAKRGGGREAVAEERREPLRREEQRRDIVRLEVREEFRHAHFNEPIKLIQQTVQQRQLVGEEAVAVCGL
jgi:hypothetical protein